MFHGNVEMSKLLLEEGAASFSMARVQENHLKKSSSIYLRRRPCLSNLPCLLAPLLEDSPCLRVASKKFGQKFSFFTLNRFTVPIFNDVVQYRISPLVDLGWFCTREVEKTLHELIKAHTHFKHLTDEKVFREIAIIPLLFGHLTGGLRQLCFRKILDMLLFNNNGGRQIKRLH